MTRLALTLALLSLGCSKDKVSPSSEETAPAATVVLAPPARAREIYTTRCALCHGQTGKGDGPSAATLQPRPRDFGDEDFQKIATDDALRRVILKGGGAVGKSVTMPQNPDLEDKPEVVSELVKIVRGFRPQP